jgi:CBS domain-containing membrane protein
MNTIRDVMNDQPISIGPDASLHEAIELLVKHNISGLAVVEPDGTILGVFGDRDLLKVFYEPEAHSIRSVMKRDPETFSVDAPLVDVFDYLMSEDFRRVLIHEDNKLVGLVSRADLMPAILDVLLDKTA